MNTTNTSLALGPELTIAFAAAAHQTLAEALEATPAGLSLDLGSVSDFDSAGVQLLLATQRTLSSRGQHLQITAASPAVRDALSTFGLQELMAGASAA